MAPPDLNDAKISTLDIAKYNGYVAAKKGRDQTRNEYVDPHHKQAWIEGFNLYVSEAIA